MGPLDESQVGHNNKSYKISPHVVSVRPKRKVGREIWSRVLPSLSHLGGLTRPEDLVIDLDSWVTVFSLKCIVTASKGRLKDNGRHCSFISSMLRLSQKVRFPRRIDVTSNGV